MTSLQEKLHAAWVEAERKVAHLTVDSLKEPTIEEVAAKECSLLDYLDDRLDDLNAAIGFRNGLFTACAIAEVPGFNGSS